MNYTIKKEFTDKELMQRVTDVLEIRNLMGRHAYYHSKGLHVRELEECWVQKPENQATASFGQNWGYNVGMKRIDAYYGQGSVENFKRDLEALAAADPTVEVKPENYGMGSLVIHALTAPYIEVAADGKTAQGLWYTPGAVGGTHPDGSSSGMLMYEKYGVDFIREDGEWKIWHLFVGTDFAVNAGEDLKGDTILEQERKVAAGEAQAMPHPMAQCDDPDFIPMDAYSLKYNYSFYPPLPEPHYSFDECVSNGPEGNPNYKKEGK